MYHHVRHYTMYQHTSLVREHHSKMCKNSGDIGIIGPSQSLKILQNGCDFRNWHIKIHHIRPEEQGFEI